MTKVTVERLKELQVKPVAPPRAPAFPPETQMVEKQLSQIPQAARDILLYLDGRPEARGDLLEIGICYGGTASIRMMHMRPEKILVTVDPHGNMPYHARGEGFVTRMYGDEQFKASVHNMLLTAIHFNTMYQHWPMRSDNFLQDILPHGLYRGGAWKPYHFGSVMLDGSHMSVDVGPEIAGVVPYLDHHGSIFIDNCDYEQPDGSVLAHGIQETCDRLGLKVRFFETNDESWNWDPVAVIVRPEAESVLDFLTAKE